MPYHTHIIQQVLGLEDVLQGLLSPIQGEWLWNDSIAGGDPGTGYVASNTTQLSSATQLFISTTTSNGGSIPPVDIYQTGDLIYLVDEDRIAYGRYSIVAADGTDPLFTEFDVIPDFGAGNPQQDNVIDLVYIPQALTPAERVWVKESTHIFEHYLATTTSNMWTEIARITEPEGVWRTGYANIVARRTDAPERVLMYANFNVWRDGAAPVVAASDKYSQAGGNQLMDFRVIGDGNDAVAQVKGFPVQTWEWDLTYFFRDVT